MTDTFQWKVQIITAKWNYAFIKLKNDNFRHVACGKLYSDLLLLSLSLHSFFQFHMFHSKIRFFSFFRFSIFTIIIMLLSVHMKLMMKYFFFFILDIWSAYSYVCERQRETTHALHVSYHYKKFINSLTTFSTGFFFQFCIT